MKKRFEQPEGSLSLEDQAILKELGISGMPRGLEYALKQFESAMDASKRIQRRAEGLESLELNEKSLMELAHEKNISIEEARERFRLFRDAEPGWDHQES